MHRAGRRPDMIAVERAHSDPQSRSAERRQIIAQRDSKREVHQQQDSSAVALAPLDLLAQFVERAVTQCFKRLSTAASASVECSTEIGSEFIGHRSRLPCRVDLYRVRNDAP